MINILINIFKLWYLYTYVSKYVIRSYKTRMTTPTSSEAQKYWKKCVSFRAGVQMS